MKTPYEKQVSGLKKGPLKKSEATVTLEKMLSLLLDANTSLVISYNPVGELLLTLNNATYNLSKILEYTNFEHLQIAPQLIENYVAFLQIKDKTHFIPALEETVTKFPSKEDFQKRDPKGLYDALAYGEKLAINIYTTSAYAYINSFLRTLAKDQKLKVLPIDEQGQRIRELILATCIASSGLLKINRIDIENEENTGQVKSSDMNMEELTRSEKKEDMPQVFNERVKNVKERTPGKRDSAFTSSSMFDKTNFSKYDTKTVISQPVSENPLGKKIYKLAEIESEGEVLFIPGTQMKFYSYHQDNKGRHFFSAIPLRSLDGISHFSYSARNMDARHHLLVIRQQLLVIVDSKKKNQKKTSFSLFSKQDNLKKILKAVEDIINHLEFGERINHKNYSKAIAKLNELVDQEFKENNDKEVTPILVELKKNLEQEMSWSKTSYSKNLAPEKVLAEMKKLDKKFKEAIFSNKEALDNLAKIKEICKADYRDSAFYGHSSLNRKILLDARIAKLLTPETIALIFAYDALLKKGGKEELTDENPIALFREGKENDVFVSMADAIFYGFNDGLSVVKYMPNNDRQYGQEEYEQQKLDFENNTRMIISNIFKASEYFALDPYDDKYSFKSDFRELIPLEKRLAHIVDTINIIKEKGLGTKLVFVKDFDPDHIRGQSIKGFERICSFKQKDSVLEVLEVGITNLNDIAKKFVSRVDLLLNGYISHMFYDRVHLEALLEQDVQIKIMDKYYTFAELFEEIVAESINYPVAMEQLEKRFSLIETHLNSNFTSAYVAAREQTSEASLLQSTQISP
jgi:hypothetical protein